MIKKLENHLSHNFHFLNGKKLLLATSGGLDSMVMAHLFHQLNYEIAIAHCNFQLRGVESFEDQNFVQEYANANTIPLFVTQFDTKAFAEDYKLSTQVAARELRYNWFYELLETEKYDYILTAHHADDNLETFLINLSRGTGLEGLTGIPEQNENIIRPLLQFSRQEIENYAKENNIKWREDSSNASDKYLRNKIRHHLVPMLKELNQNECHPHLALPLADIPLLMHLQPCLVIPASRFAFFEKPKENLDSIPLTSELNDAGFYSSNIYQRHYYCLLSIESHLL